VPGQGLGYKAQSAAILIHALGFAVDRWHGKKWCLLFMINASIYAMEHVEVIDTVEYNDIGKRTYV
jgi:hypothetical protein